MTGDDQMARELESLGLTSYETRAYLSLLRRSSFSAADLSRISGLPRQRIYDVIDVLVDKGLCQVRTSSPLTIAAVSPTLALAALEARRVIELEGVRVEVQETAASLASTLKGLYKEGQKQQGPLSYLEIYRDQSQFEAVATSLGQGATAEIRLLLSGPAAFPQGEHVRLLGEALSRGVACRALCGPGTSLSEELGSLMGVYINRGLTVRRMSGGLPGPRTMIFDREGVLLFLPDPLSGTASFQVLAIRHLQMLEMMEYTFESLWEQKQAVELDAQGHTRN
jgi:HTH-type transcriptional regulator, sugar sensing transcriptional regulator